MKRIKGMLIKAVLMPFWLMMGIPDGDPPSGGTPPADPPAGDPPPPSDDLGALFTPEEVTAKKESLAAAKAEEERRAALTEEERTAEDAKKAEEEGKNKAPDEYAEFTIPEGVEIDKDVLGLFTPLAKELGLTQEKAQKLVDVHAQAQRRYVEQWEADKAKRAESVKSDNEIGGDKFADTQETETRFIKTFLNDSEYTELVAQMKGFGVIPMLTKLLVRAGKRVSEDKVILPGSTVHSGDGDRITNFYSKSKMT